MKRLLVLAWIAVVCSGCRDGGDGRSVPRPRVITFAPHITDIAFDMGVGDHVVGVSSYCIVPEGVSRPAVGNAFQINHEAILSREPDILFFNTKDADYEPLRRLRPSLKLVRMRNGTLAELRAGVKAMGEAMGESERALALLERIDGRLSAVADAVAGRGRPRTLVVQGVDHPTTVGAGFVTDELIAIAGGTNAAAEFGLAGWVAINLETVVAMRPEVLVCLASPGQADAARAYWSRFEDIPAVAAGRLHVIDDPRMTIPGSRVGATARKLAGMIHPEAFDGEGDGDG